MHYSSAAGVIDTSVQRAAVVPDSEASSAPLITTLKLGFADMFE